VPRATPRTQPPALLATLLLAAAAAGCSDKQASSCPGVPVGTFDFTVSNPSDAASDCAKKAPSADDRVVGTFQGALAEDLALGTAALCLPGEHAEPYFGHVEAGLYTLDSAGGLAVLGTCGPNCSTQATLSIAGSIDGSGAFVGTLTETFGYESGACGTCALPCAAPYGLVGVR
jgi:hypothetical protein